MALKFRVELVWQDEKETASSIYGEMISVDRNLIRAIKEML